jgi:hypothetical protein
VAQVVDLDASDRAPNSMVELSLITVKGKSRKTPQQNLAVLNFKVVKLNQTKSPNIKLVEDVAGHPRLLWLKSQKPDIRDRPCPVQQFDLADNLTK